MAPIQFLFTSVLVLSAAVVAAPINTNHVDAGMAGESVPSKHHSEPMRVADPVMSSVPVMSIDTQAMKSSTAAMAIQTPPSTGSEQQSDGVLNSLPVKRDVEGAEAHDETYTEKALKGFHGWMHHDSKDKQETPEISSAADSLGLEGIAKRADPVNGLLDGVLAKRNDMESDNDMIDGLAKRDVDDAIATKSGQLNNGLNIRQLSVISSLATSAIANAGATAAKIGKVAIGKHRRGNGDAGSIASTATAGLNLGNHPKAGSDGDDEGADVDDIAAEVAEREQTLHDATSPKGHAGGHLDKRQPPIAGSNALSIVKGLVANPSAALSPVTKGAIVGGTALGDMARQ